MILEKVQRAVAKQFLSQKTDHSYLLLGLGLAKLQRQLLGQEIFSHLKVRSSRDQPAHQKNPLGAEWIKLYDTLGRPVLPIRPIHWQPSKVT